jgi:hypothetical protein
MRTPHPEEPRVETITAALIYLMSHYAQTGCPRLAICVAPTCNAFRSAPMRRLCCATFARRCTVHGSRRPTARRQNRQCTDLTMTRFWSARRNAVEL